MKEIDLDKHEELGLLLHSGDRQKRLALAGHLGGSVG